MKKLLIALILVLGAAFTQQLYNGEWHRQLFVFDASGYYVYLPATFIYHDLDRMDFYAHIDSVYQPAFTAKWYGLHYVPEIGKRVNKYPLGPAIGEAPFFLAAQAYTSQFHNQPADGYGSNYRLAIITATLCQAFAGLLFLGILLARLWGYKVAAFTVFIIGLGTNFYCYSSTDYGMAHIWLFMLAAALLLSADQWHRYKRPASLYWIALCAALILISRPADVTLFLIPLLWSVHDESVRSRWQSLLGAGWHAAGALMLGFLVLSLQLGYWKMTTGHFLYYSYGDEGFDFLHPHIFRGLFSYKKGWFVYTPLALAGLIGIIPLYRHNARMGRIVFLYFILTLYIVFSWKVWWYGWSFSSRPLIDSLPVLAIPMAALIAWFSRQRLIIAMSGSLVALFFIWLNIYQTNQYVAQVLPGDNVTKEYYWRVWNSMHASDEDKRFLE